MTGQSDRDSFEIELAIEREMGKEMQRERGEENCCSFGDNKSLRLMTSRQERERESQDWALDKRKVQVQVLLRSGK